MTLVAVCGTLPDGFGGSVDEETALAAETFDGIAAADTGTDSFAALIDGFRRSVFSQSRARNTGFQTSGRICLVAS